MDSTGDLSLRAVSVTILCIALAASGCTSDHHDHSPPGRTITYRVSGHGTADITYRAPHAHGARSVTAARLPWSTTVDLPTTEGAPVLTVVLGTEGGQAACSIAVAGRRVQRAIASGTFGRATCRTDSGAERPSQGPDRG